MSSFLLIKELSKELGYNLSYLRLLCNQGVIPYLYKKKIKYKAIRNGKSHVVERWMWVVDTEKLDALKDFVRRLKIKNGKKEDPKFKWTRTAIECYQAKLICSNCQNYEVCKSIESHEHTKPIKAKVIELYKKYGIPPERIIENE